MKIVVMIHQQIIIMEIMEEVVFEENHHIMQLKNVIDQVLMKEYLN